MKKHIYYFVLTFLVLCNEGFSQTTINALTEISNEIKSSNYELTIEDIDKLADRLDQICDRDISLGQIKIEEYTTIFERFLPLDSVKNRYGLNETIEDYNFDLLIPYIEIYFRVSIGVQEALGEWLVSLGFTGMMEVMEEYQKIQNTIVSKKTEYLSFMFLFMPHIKNRESKVRCYTAIDRMLANISIPKSEKGICTLKEYPLMIQTEPGEFNNIFQGLKESEEDIEIIKMIDKQVQRIEGQKDY